MINLIATTKYETREICRNTITGQWWDGKGFNVAAQRPTGAAVLTHPQAAAVRYTYLNTESIPVEVERAV
jgi:hypothetical protein